MPTSPIQWIQSFLPRADRPATQHPDMGTELHRARTALLNCVQDCSEDCITRLKQKIQSARTHRELWFLRIDVYHCVSLRHHEAMATERVRSLAPHFDGWIDPK